MDEHARPSPLRERLFRAGMNPVGPGMRPVPLTVRHGASPLSGAFRHVLSVRKFTGIVKRGFEKILYFIIFPFPSVGSRETPEKWPGKSVSGAVGIQIPRGPPRFTA